MYSIRTIFEDHLGSGLLTTQFLFRISIQIPETVIKNLLHGKDDKDCSLIVVFTSLFKFDCRKDKFFSQIFSMNRYITAILSAVCLKDV